MKVLKGTMRSQIVPNAALQRPEQLQKPSLAARNVSRTAAWRASVVQQHRSRGPALKSSANPAAQPATGGGSGGGSIGGSGAGGGGGGGDSWNDGADDSEEPKKKGAWKGWSDRVAADPEFPFKVLVEQVIGVGASVLGDMSSRKDWGIHELDFVFSTLVVGSIMNFSLMYLLAKTPSTVAAAGSGSIIARLFDENTLKNMGAPGGNFFEPGFPLHKRFVNLAYKGVVFGLVGFVAGVVGTSLSNTLIATRKKLDPSYQPQNESPGIVQNAAVWGTHMGISSNTRYQLLNGLDMVLQPVVPPAAFKALSTVIRLLNNIVGGMSFVTLAKLFNVQPSSPDPATA